MAYFLVYRGYIHAHMSQLTDGPPATNAHVTSCGSCTTFEMAPDMGHSIHVCRDFEWHDNHCSLKSWPRHPAFKLTAYTTTSRANPTQQPPKKASKTSLCDTQVPILNPILKAASKALSLATQTLHPLASDLFANTGLTLWN